ncbi:type I-E CRISPR-associated protein Cas6/Cse3/CasE [Nocardiopsis salina]|uniref:type I-E CRISPR-associated protein Cas6/Cse3/CasE n=1 Tax=Nocardiopsis salina TaxID=245836 RepID=UPI0003494E76|nr:type I-E CRISPR-associated protein Cas6/Cse3/CasE [Nocardiopsis salina]
MYLSRISLDPERTTGMEQWAVMGRAVRKAVDPDPDSDARVLWARLSPTILVVSSDTAPAWGKIPGALSVTYLPLPRYQEGETVRWELITAPTEQKQKKAETTAEDENENPRPRGKKVSVPESGFDDWLDHKFEGALQIEDVSWKRLGGRPARYHFTGTAIVEDSEALQDLELDGIGGGIATGAGLLLTSPLDPR